MGPIQILASVIAMTDVIIHISPVKVLEEKLGVTTEWAKLCVPHPPHPILLPTHTHLPLPPKVKHQSTTHPPILKWSLTYGPLPVTLIMLSVEPEACSDLETKGLSRRGLKWHTVPTLQAEAMVECIMRLNGEHWVVTFNDGGNFQNCCMQSSCLVSLTERRFYRLMVAVGNTREGGEQNTHFSPYANSLLPRSLTWGFLYVCVRFCVCVFCVWGEGCTCGCVGPRVQMGGIVIMWGGLCVYV